VGIRRPFRGIERAGIHGHTRRVRACGCRHAGAELRKCARISGHNGKPPPGMIFARACTRAGTDRRRHCDDRTSDHCQKVSPKRAIALSLSAKPQPACYSWPRAPVQHAVLAIVYCVICAGSAPCPAEVLLDFSCCRLNAIHPEYEPWCVIVGQAVATNFIGKTREVRERDREWLRAHELRRQMQ
jgi:hypothetical protein